MTKAYQRRLRALLSPAEAAVLKQLSTPIKIQDYLEALPQNFPTSREAMRSVRGVLKARKAHCMEGALLAAAALAYHGQAPLLLDLRSYAKDEDHVVALFKRGGRWGALSKTNHAALRYRDPVYLSVRELAMSYFNEYYVWWGGQRNKDWGRKTMLDYSKPFDLSRIDPELWVTAARVEDIAEMLDDSPHSPVAPISALRNLRRATKIEKKIMHERDWQRPSKKKAP